MEENRRMECIECHSSFNRLGDDFMRQIAELVGPMSFIATNIKLALTSVPACRQCSRCNRIQLVNQESVTFPAVACKACGHAYCFEHGDAHAGYPCPRPTQEQITSEEQISRVCKRCPGCKMPTQKNGGCAHMSCVVCGCSWCWTCAKPRCGSGEDRTELLSTWRDDSTNWLSTLLFLVIRFLAGPNSVFYGAVTCQCDAEARYSYDDIQWENRAGRNNRMRWLLLRAVAVRCRLRHASGCECLLVAYAVYISGYLAFLAGHELVHFMYATWPPWLSILKFAGCLAWCYFVTFTTLFTHMGHHLLLTMWPTILISFTGLHNRIINRLNTNDNSLPEVLLTGYFVAVLTARMLPALRELVHKGRWLRAIDILLFDGSVYVSPENFPDNMAINDVLFDSSVYVSPDHIIIRAIRGAVAFVGTLLLSATLLGCSWSTPGQPNRHIWMMEFWLVWLLNLVCWTFRHNQKFAWSFVWGYLDPESRQDPFGLGIIWGVLGMVLKLVVELDHLAFTAVAATATLLLFRLIDR